MEHTMAWRYCNSPADFRAHFSMGIHPRHAAEITKFMHEELQGKFRATAMQGWGDYLELAYIREQTRGEA